MKGQKQRWVFSEKVEQITVDLHKITQRNRYPNITAQRCYKHPNHCMCVSVCIYLYIFKRPPSLGHDRCPSAPPVHPFPQPHGGGQIQKGISHSRNGMLKCHGATEDLWTPDQTQLPPGCYFHSA